MLLKEIKKPLKKCVVCGLKFTINKDECYTIKKNDGSLLQQQLSYYDAIDCTYCGCQNILWQRLKEVENFKKSNKND